MDRFHLVGLATTGLSCLIIAQAFLERKGNFFASCIHITQSNVNLLVILGMTFYYVVLSGKLIQRLWFGPLRALEIEHLYERSWYSVMDTCLALTIFRDGFDLLFVIRFVTLLFIKTFHWITGDRVDFMEQATETGWRFHSRMLSIIAILFIFDVSMLISAINSTLEKGHSMLIVFGFEYTLLTIGLGGIFVKYVLHSIDARYETRWEEKSLYFFYVDLVLDFFKLMSYITFFAIVLHFYGLPLHIVRDVYMTIRSFIQKVRDLIRYREATRNMHERYPTATESELSATDGVCIVCREEMVSPNTTENPALYPIPETPKKLPCGHIFHFRCLRSWLERQQACPTCRQSVLNGNGNAPENVNQNRPVPQRPDLPNPQPNFRNEQIPDITGIDQGGSGPSRPVINSRLTIPTAPPLLYPIQLTRIGPASNARALDSLTKEQLESIQSKSREAIIEQLRLLDDVQGQIRGVSTQLAQILECMPSPLDHIDQKDKGPMKQ